MNLAAAPNISGHMITLPPAVRQKLNTSRPLTLRINNQTLQVPPSLFVASETGVKVFLPPGLIPSNSATQAVSNDSSGPRPVNVVTNQREPQSLTVQHPAPPAEPKVTNIEPIEIDPDSPATSPVSSPVKTTPPDDLPVPESTPAVSEDTPAVPEDTAAVPEDTPAVSEDTPAVSEDTPAVSESSDSSVLKEPQSYTNKGQVKLSQRTLKSGVNPLCCYFQKLHAGYDCMQVIFKYLGIVDLLR